MEKTYTNPPYSFAARRPLYAGCDCLPGNEGIHRRDFMKVAGLGFLATALGLPRMAMAGPFEGEDIKDGHLVPANKKLSNLWGESLVSRGEKEVYNKGKAFKTIGMPIGGIAAGQLYLCGDGTLGCWQVMNHLESNWVAGTHSTFEHKHVEKPIDQGFAVTVEQGGKTQTRRLYEDGFDKVQFNGQYPIGLVTYEDEACPVKVEMEAFSPFIPMNWADSGLPATVFNLTMTNTSNQPAKAQLMGWMENAVCQNCREVYEGKRRVSVYDEGGLRTAKLDVEPGPGDSKRKLRENILFETFEREDWGDWKVEGTAFGPGPSTGALEGQHPVVNMTGQRCVNSYHGGDNTKGKLTSPSFKIERNYINFFVGGGAYTGETCVNLVVDGEVVNTATGANSETLLPYSWWVKERFGQTAHIEIIDNHSGPWGHILVDRIEFADTQGFMYPPNIRENRDFGTFALSTTEKGSGTALPEFLEDKKVVERETGESTLMEQIFGLLRSNTYELKPGESRTVPFVFAWHFPNGEQGNAYAVRFQDAPEVAKYVMQHHDQFTKETRLWRDTWYDSTLPWWLLDRLFSTVSILATGTCRWWANGRFWAFEGVACCAGTCTHVWNYAHAHARLFPELGRNIREMQDLEERSKGGGFHPDTGLVGFRSDDNYAADGQCGTVLKCYREHLCSADDSFLKKNWPRIKKALEFSITHDENADGIIEDLQHNTYDINYHGANTFVGSLYLAALRAGEDMARDMGDTAFANVCKALYESGSKESVRRLWNGQYFEQDVDLEKHPIQQYKNGCLSDHLFGQCWSHMVGLGYIYPADKVQTALDSVFKYNWTPDVGPYNEKHKPFRWFISPGQAGLFTCTWPLGGYLPMGTSYKNEIWTGIEYQVASHLAWEGRTEEALAICRGIHDRYQPNLYNPYNEIECGDHYARAMASWGVLAGLSGFGYHGPKQKIAFAPRFQEKNFKAAFTAAEGWGSYSQKRNGNDQTHTIEMGYGNLKLREITLEGPEGKEIDDADIYINGKKLKAEMTQEKQVKRTNQKECAWAATLRLENTVTLLAGDKMEVQLEA